ncbi:MAG: DNA cytosine methyltransferase [Lewinellaceae bacterium]|nr:DNA cytosine methyltransferase [Lewinellaceae bacterium]
MEIPIIDIFAGPGGLGEGFCAFRNPETGEKEFKIALSIEKEFHAHQTLTLRSFFRQFSVENIPGDYYDFVRGNLSMEELFEKWPKQAEKAQNEAWKAQLGEDENAVPNNIVNKRIKGALKGAKDWLLIGGPPCQAYSVVGRVRRQEKMLDERKDERVGLYKQYLRILAVHNPAVFVMENVRGLLSAQTKASRVFSNIMSDLTNPVEAYLSENGSNGIHLECPGYKIYSLVAKPERFIDGNPVYNPQDFLIFSENHGVPQTRHRVILLGIRKDFDICPGTLPFEDEISAGSVLYGLPRLRSGLSKVNDEGKNWKKAISHILNNKIIKGIDDDVKRKIQIQLNNMTIPRKGTGLEFVSDKKANVNYRSDWYLDENLGGVCNHSSRSHMESDLLRYFFVSCFGKVKKRSPKLEDFPAALLPDHKNVQAGINDRKFADRFRVQLWNKPCKTITSHISKDGHYYIHPDPTQCRSFTVREAARIQTFPDNYYFCGSRTAQFTQVGNAVPPLLANKIAEIVHEVFNKIKITNKKLLFVR